MKKMAFLGVALVLMGSASARSWDDIQRSGQLIIGTATEDYPPFTYTENNQLRGWEYDYGNALAQKLGLKPVWKRNSFNTLLNYQRSGDFDIVIASLGPTAKARQLVDFADTPEYCSGETYISLKQNPVDRDNVRGKVIGALVGGSHVDEVNFTPGIAQARFFPSEAEGVRSILFGRTDAFLLDSVFAQGFLKRYPGLLTLGKTYNNSISSIALSKNSPVLKAKLDAAMSDILQSGTYAKITARYFSEPIQCKKGGQT